MDHTVPRPGARRSRRWIVTATARWPERLGHVATLLRAEAAVVLTVSPNEVRAVFSHRIDPTLDWEALLSRASLEKALRSPIPVGLPIAAGRWDDRVAYAALAALETLETPALLVLLRHGVPFDAVELASAESARALLALGTPDVRAADADRVEAVLSALARSDETVPGPQLRILVAEAAPAMRIGLRALITGAGLDVIAATASCAEAMVVAREGRPDAALVSLELSDAAGSGVIARLAAVSPTLPLVALADRPTRDGVTALLAVGAAGVVPRDAPAERIVAALRAAATGLAAFPRDALRSGTDHPAEAAPAAHPAHPAQRATTPRDALTTRELELLRYLAQGHTNKEIARAMVLAEDTVKKGVQTIIAKLGATDRTHAVVLALRSGHIE